MSAAPTPKTVGRYVIDRLLGAGAMGSVYLARDPDLGRLVAVKTVRAADLDPETRARYLERFRNEARAAGRLHHPSIVQVYDVGEDPAVGPFLVFEYVRGATLREVIRTHGALSPRRLADLAAEVGAALDLAHREGIIHRDIKPENLLVTEEGRVKLADFGIARVPDAALTRDGQFLGTPCYAAPETLRGGVYSPRSDVFSFAAVLYEALTGKRAFPGDDAVAVAHKVANEEPARPSQARTDVVIPEGLDREVMRGLAKEPGTRFASAGELGGAVVSALVAAKLLDGAPAAASFGAVPTRRSTRGPTARFVVLALLALGGGVGLVLALGRPGDPALAGDGDGGVPSLVDPADRPTGTRAGSGADAGALPATDGAVAKEGAVAPAAPDAGLSAHEREEAAKDAIAEAERHLAAGERDQARAALDRARALDPENTDLPALTTKLSE